MQWSFTKPRLSLEGPDPLSIVGMKIPNVVSWMGVPRSVSTGSQGQVIPSVGSQLSQSPQTTTVLPRYNIAKTLSSARRFVHSADPQPFPPLLKEKMKIPRMGLSDTGKILTLSWMGQGRRH